MSGSLEIIDHGDKILVVGETYPHRGTLARLGGQWDAVQRGWALPAASREAVAALAPKTPPPVANAATEVEALAFIAGNTWVYAKSMPKTPHEYVARERSATAEWDRFSALIRLRGTDEKWGRRVYRYLVIGDYKYWVIDNILNRELVTGGLPGRPRPGAESEPVKQPAQSLFED